MDVRFNGIVPDLSRIPGVSNFTVQANRARFEVRGDLHPILDALAASDVLGLDVREPSLEEIFLAHYGDES
jgi:ABC-2 type transport system ATP-binding protein